MMQSTAGIQSTAVPESADPECLESAAAAAAAEAAEQGLYVLQWLCNDQLAIEICLIFLLLFGGVPLSDTNHKCISIIKQVSHIYTLEKHIMFVNTSLPITYVQDRYHIQVYHARLDMSQHQAAGISSIPSHVRLYAISVCHYRACVRVLTNRPLLHIPHYPLRQPNISKKTSCMSLDCDECNSDDNPLTTCSSTPPNMLHAALCHLDMFDWNDYLHTHHQFSHCFLSTSENQCSEYQQKGQLQQPACFTTGGD
jgi:hypothetical protein